MNRLALLAFVLSLFVLGLPEPLQAKSHVFSGRLERVVDGRILISVEVTPRLRRFLRRRGLRTVRSEQDVGHDTLFGRRYYHAYPLAPHVPRDTQRLWSSRTGEPVRLIAEDSARGRHVVHEIIFLQSPPSSGETRP